MRFENRVAIVTGATSGIGLATARRLAEDGAHVVVVSRRPEATDEVARGLGAAGLPDALAAPCDVSDPAGVETVVGATMAKFGRLDVVVNNAGMMLFKPLEAFTDEDWRKVLAVDLLGAVHFTRQGFLHMTHGGAIVNVASVHALATSPLVAPYAAAKAALLSLTRSTSIEGKPKRIRANAVLPGAIDTPMLWENPNVKSGAETIDPADLGQPEEVAAAIAFLASDEASFVTGELLRVDGGRLDRL